MYLEDNQYDTQGERLKKIRIELGLSQSEMAKKLEMTQGGYSDIERGNVLISSRTLVIIGKSFNIDLNWLIKGAADHNVVNESFVKYRPAQILSPIPANAGIPFVYTQEWLNDVNAVNIPGIKGQLIVFPIDGMSMLPGLEPGSYLGCRRVESKDHIAIGSAYIIVSMNGIWIKRITSIDGAVVLSSDNPDYADFSIPYEDVREIYHPIVKIMPYDAADKSGNYMLQYIDIKQK
jgi:transcriptional regulator with XRE-family HTH domain